MQHAMIAKKRGRTPAHEDRLLTYAEEAASDAICFLFKYAAGKGLTVETLREKLSCDRKTLHGYLNSRFPKLSTVAHFCTSIGLPPLTARALLRKMTHNDHLLVAKMIESELNGAQSAAYFCKDVTDAKRIRCMIAKLTEANVIELHREFILGLSSVADCSVGAPPQVVALITFLRGLMSSTRISTRKMDPERDRNGLALLGATFLELNLSHGQVSAIRAIVDERLHGYDQGVSVYDAESDLDERLDWNARVNCILEAVHSWNGRERF